MASIPIWLAILQAIGSFAFGIGGIVLAVMAYRMNKLNNFGVTPLVMVSRVQQLQAGDDRWVKVTLEVWNRHKYPITLHAVAVQFHRPKSTEVLEGVTYEQDGWSYTPDGVGIHRVRERIEKEGVWTKELTVENAPGEIRATAAIRYMDPLEASMKVEQMVEAQKVGLGKKLE